MQVDLIRREALTMQFSVKGAPLYQGSKLALISGKRERRGRDVWVKNPIASLVEQANRPTKTRAKNALTNWKRVIAEMAACYAPDVLWCGAIELECVFVIARSPSHFTGKGAIRKGAPEFPRLDLDKMVRAVGDALTGVVYADDSQIVGFGGTTKRYSKTKKGIGGVFVKVTRL